MLSRPLGTVKYSVWRLQMPLNTMFSAPLARAVAYLAVVSAMPSITSGSELRTAHWVVSSSCTSLEDPNTFWAMLLQPLRTTTASTAASAKARIRFVLLMFFYPQKQQVKNAISLHDTIVYRIFFLLTRDFRCLSRSMPSERHVRRRQGRFHRSGTGSHSGRAPSPRHRRCAGRSPAGPARCRCTTG